jgi:hypothetical protein
MSDPLRTDAARPADSLADTDKEARIEQLLLSGLDQYFAGQYEQAINIWTRVVFLERGHGRARAYIERARSALAERHRESEELLHRGIAAFNNGQTDAARELIMRAVDQGGPQDVALVLLERLNRLATPAGASDASRPAAPARLTSAPLAVAPPDRQSWRVPAAAALAILMGAAAVGILSGITLPIWLTDPAGVPQGQVVAMPPDPLPIALSSERRVARARAFQAAGRLHDALRALDGIDLADPMRPEADRLRGELQRKLLESAVTEAAR